MMMMEDDCWEKMKVLRDDVVGEREASLSLHALLIVVRITNWHNFDFEAQHKVRNYELSTPRQDTTSTLWWRFLFHF